MRVDRGKHADAAGSGVVSPGRADLAGAVGVTDLGAASDVS